MTVDVARKRTRRTTKAAPEAPAPPRVASESIQIGEIEQTIFSCPSCQRPLAVGAHRCPGCKTLLVMRVPVSRATVFVAIGLAVGLAVGSAVGGMALLNANLTRNAEIAAAVKAALAAQPHVAAAPTAAPLATARPVASANPVGGSTGIPALARSAMLQAATVNTDLAASVPVLQAALNARTFDTVLVFETLRGVSADAVTGRQLAAHIGGWSSGNELGTNLTTFYASVQQAAADGLTNSVRNAPAYKAAAAQMVRLLSGLTTVDGQLRSVAGDAGVAVPAPVAP